MTIEGHRNPTPIYQSVLMGSLMGATESIVNHPLWTMKTRQQAGLPFTLHPREIYRGLLVSSASSIPLDILQVTISRVFFERVLPQDSNTSDRKFLAGFIGGYCSSVVSCPAETIMVQQQLFKTSFIQACKDIFIKKGARHFFIGFTPTSIRDGFFYCGVFGGVPALKDICEKRKITGWYAMGLSGFCTGLVTAILSHPFDVIKIRAQSSDSSFSMRASIVKLHKERALFQGLNWRISRVSSAVFILGNLNSYLENYYKCKSI